MSGVVERNVDKFLVIGIGVPMPELNTLIHYPRLLDGIRCPSQRPLAMVAGILRKMRRGDSIRQDLFQRGRSGRRDGLYSTVSQ